MGTNREDLEDQKFFEVFEVFVVESYHQTILRMPSFIRFTFQFSKNPRGQPLSLR